MSATARSLFSARPVEALSGAWLPIRLTALFLLVNGGQLWYLVPIMITLAGLGLIFHSPLRTPALWMAVTLILVTWILRLWPIVDNHQYLAAYWSLSILLALGTPDPRRSLAVSARWLVGLVFLWAVLWKGVLSPDFRDGRFFTVRLMADARFEDPARMLSGLTRAEIRENRAYLDPYSDEEGGRPDPVLRLTPRFSFWVTALTWATLLSEAFLAMVFLLPLRGRATILRHGGLIAFCLGTFALAPVPTFGWLLIILGLAQVEPHDRRMRAIYVVVWFLIAFVSQAPWPALIHRLT